MTGLVAALMAVVALSVPVQEPSGSSGAQDSPPLFASHDLLEFTIRGPLEDIFDHRDQESEEYPASLEVLGGMGQSETGNVDIRTRGRARLQRRVCRFPPLRLDFPQDSVAGTLFAEQNRLKLVTHCQDGREEYEQYVLLEYLTYRVYNLLTPLSFRVRLAHITYEDTGGDRETLTRYGFLIEDEEAVAKRNEWMYLAIPRVPPDVLDPDNLALAGVFHYLIGNTDWSAFMPDPGAFECCHNAKTIGSPAGPVFTVPYDFDMSGLVDTRYANNLYRDNLDELGLRNVRQRRFRGLCRSMPLLPEVFALLNQQRAEIEALFSNQEGLEDDVTEDTLEYIEEFYEVINDEGRVRSEFERRCRDA